MPSENEIRENLLDAGCTGAEADSILDRIRTGDRKGAERLIDASRKKQLERMHDSQRCIDRLDYLCWQMNK